MQLTAITSLLITSCEFKRAQGSAGENDCRTHNEVSAGDEPLSEA